MTTTVAAATAAPATTWTIDPTHTHVEFAIRHLMITTVKGRFGDVQGTVLIDEEDPSRSKIEVTIGVASIDTRVGQRDDHLRSSDFFEADRFPHLTFKSRLVEPSDEGFRVVGDLTIRDVTREVSLDVTSEGRVSDPWGGLRAGFSAATKIKRQDFGLVYNIAIESGGFVIGDDVKISIEAELIKA